MFSHWLSLQDNSGSTQNKILALLEVLAPSSFILFCNSRVLFSTSRIFEVWSQPLKISLPFCRAQWLMHHLCGGFGLFSQKCLVCSSELGGWATIGGRWYPTPLLSSATPLQGAATSFVEKVLESWWEAALCEMWCKFLVFCFWGTSSLRDMKSKPKRAKKRIMSVDCLSKVSDVRQKVIFKKSCKGLMFISWI